MVCRHKTYEYAKLGKHIIVLAATTLLLLLFPIIAGATVATPTDMLPQSENSENESGNFLEFFSVVADWIPLIVTGGATLMGYRYLNSLKDKALVAAFSYWTQLRVRLFLIITSVETNIDVLDNMYPPSERIKWKSILPMKEEIDSLYDQVINTIQFLQQAEDQMPAYLGWTDDYNMMLEFFAKIIQYDIREPDKHFMQGTKDDRDRLWCDAKMSMDKIICEVTKAQKRAEGRLYPKTGPIRKLLSKIPKA